MPSLQDLQEFKDSLKEIGREPFVLSESGEAYDDLPLPDTEPVPLDIGESGSSVEEYPTPKASEEEDFDFGSFLDSITEEALSAPEPTVSETAEAESMLGPEEAASNLEQSGPAQQEAFELSEDMNFAVPDDLLQGFSDEIEASRTEKGSDSTDFNLSDFNLEESPPAESPLEETTLEQAEFEPPSAEQGGEEAPLEELPVESSTLEESVPEVTDFEGAAFETASFPEDVLADTGFGAAESEEFAPSAEPAETAEALQTPEAEAGPESDILDLESLGGEELGFEEVPPKQQELPETQGSELSEPSEPEAFDFSIPEFEDSFPETSPGTAAPAATGSLGDLSSLGGSEFGEFDEFSLGSESLEGPAGPSATENKESGLGSLPGIEDFSLSGIDDLFVQNKEPVATATPSGRPSKTTEAQIPSVEEISLSEEDYKKLENTLASYPLNLRIACEELIAEQAVLPDQMATLVKMLVRGAPAKETATLASRLLGRTISIPKGFEKKTGEELEAEQASFTYIFRHRVLPILELFAFVLLISASLFYLSFEFIYTPLKAESIYKKGYERIEAGDYQRANERFYEAFNLWRKKSWFFKYAQKFRDKRQYIYAEQKYEELLRFYPRDKKGALEFADFETTYLNNYAKADKILRNEILDYSVDDKEGLLALGDVNLAWGDLEPSRYEEARKAYARYMEKYGQEDAVLERMLKYFIRTDNLAEVLPLQAYFMESSKRKISGAALAEMGGYLLDKKLQDVKGVPDKNISKIEGLREVLERAIKTDKKLPEGYYHLARYFSKFGKQVDERTMLEKALSVFETAPELSSRRIGYHIDTYRRYALLLRNNKEFITAQAQLNEGLKIFEDAVQRRVLARSPEFGRLYADLADIEYFSAGNYEAALKHYATALANGWAPAEIQYRMGVIYYSQKAWAEALEKFFATSLDFPLNRRLLFALGNTTYMRGDYHAAQGYYNRLLDILETERSRFPMLVPNDRPEHMELVERLMMARNNLAATLENLADEMGNSKLRSQAFALYAESSRAWDLITRDPKSMVRSDSKNLAYLNTRNTLYPIKNYEPQIYTNIDRDVLEPSLWEEILQK